MQPIFLKVLTASLSGAWLFFFTIPQGMEWTAWLCLVPMLLVLEPGKPVVNSTIALCYGLSARFALFGWLHDAMPQFMPEFSSSAITGLFIIYIFLSALPWILTWNSACFFRKRFGSGWILMFPAFFISVEWCYFIADIFPYSFGLSQNVYPSIFQLAAVTGTPGVTFVVVMVNCLAAELIFTIREGRTLPVRAVCTVFLLISALAIWGNWRVHNIECGLAKAPVISIQQIQNDMTLDSMKKSGFYTSFQKEVFRYWVSATEAVLPGTVNLVVWPEGVVPFGINRKSAMRILNALSRTGRFAIAAGISGDRETKGDHTYNYNSVFYYNRHGKLQAVYRKQRLMPFGEYTPFSSFFHASEQERRRLVPEIKPITIPDGNAALAFTLCYEGIFPDIIRRFSRADLVVNMSNDIRVGKTAAYLHFKQLAAKAVEFGKPVYCSSRSGISALVEPHGKIKYRTGLYEKVSRKIDVRLFRTDTIYAGCGGWFLWLCVILMAAVMAWSAILSYDI